MAHLKEYFLIFLMKQHTMRLQGPLTQRTLAATIKKRKEYAKNKHFHLGEKGGKKLVLWKY